LVSGAQGVETFTSILKQLAAMSEKAGEEQAAP
jgi:hypothetical protein